MSEPNKPFYKGKYVTTWKNQRTTKDDREFTAFDTTISRSYKDGDDWKETSSFPKNALFAVMLELHEAATAINNYREEKG